MIIPEVVVAQTPTIEVDPSLVTLKVFDSFAVGINVSDVTNLWTVDVKLYWNSSLMNATSREIEVPAEWPTYLIASSLIENDYNITHGRFWLLMTALSPSSGFNGSHRFAEVEFKCLGVGECTLDLTDTELASPTTEPIPHEVVDGYVVQQEPTTTLYIDPASVYVLIDQEFTVNVSVSNVMDLFAFDFKIGYNTSLLDCMQVTLGEFFSNSYITIKTEINDAIGRLWVVGSLTSASPSTNGNMTLVALRFRCTGLGVSDLDLYDTLLLDRSAQPISPPPYIGDVNGDLRVNIFDVVLVAVVYGTELGDPDYNATRDLNSDGFIDLFDMATVTINFANNYTIPDDALQPNDNVIVHYVVDGSVAQYLMLPHGPTAVFTATPTILQVNQSVTFNASYSQPGSNGFEVCPIVEYAWDFETDGIVDCYGVAVDHNYTEMGYYTATLNVTDSQGLWDTDVQTITVLSPRPAEEVIPAGLAYLASQQNLDGSWGSWPDIKPAYTGLVLTKLQMHAYETGYDSPFDPAYPYSAEVILGWWYLFSTNASGIPVNAFKQTLSIQNHTEGESGTLDNPDSNGNGYGICFGGSWGTPNSIAYPTYTTGIVLMALEASGTPTRPNEGGIDFDNDGSADTYKQFAQDMADWLSWAQGDVGNDEGGWGYEPLDNQIADEQTDNSVSGYATLGLAAADGFGCIVPDWVRIEINAWILSIQDPVNGEPNDGGSYYDPDFTEYCNELRTGNLVFQMAFTGDSPTASRFQNALDYVSQHWTDADLDPGWGYNVLPSNYQAMFCLMKGLEYSNIDLIDLDNDDFPEHDWFEEFKTTLVSQQFPDGSWAGYWYGDSVINTAWALLTLERFAPTSEPLTIREVSYIPTCPYPFVSSSVPRQGEPVYVKANITGLTEYGRVVLSYRRGESPWWNTTLTYNVTSTLWETVIPGQVGNATVEFFLAAYNTPRSVETSSLYTFAVKSLFAGDINGDGKVNILDAIILSGNFGKTQ